MRLKDRLNQLLLTLYVMLPIIFVVLGGAFAAEFLCGRCR